MLSGVGKFGAGVGTVDECLDLGDEMVQRATVVADDLAKEEVLRLNCGGAFVEAVDLGIANVLLHGIVLQEAGPAQCLQRLGQTLVGPFGANPFDDRQQQIVDPVRHVGVGAGHDAGDRRVLVCRGVQIQRAQTFGVGLLRQQSPPYIGMVDDGDPRRGLVGHLGEVGALDAGLRVLQRVQVTR